MDELFSKKKKFITIHIYIDTMNLQGKARGETIFIVSDHPKLVNSSISKQSGLE